MPENAAIEQRRATKQPTLCCSAAAPALATTLLALTAACVDASFIASSVVTRCSSPAANATAGPCVQRIALAVTVQAGQDGTENFETEALDAVTDGSDGFTYAPASHRLSLSVYKSAVRLIYPLRYTRDYNAGPREIVLTVDGGGNGFNSVTNSCKDDPTSSSAACGWALDASGARIPWSNGFCCSCPGFLDSVFGVHHTGIVRGGGLDCSLLSHPQSAHCLRFSGLWYQGYEVQPPRVDYDLTVYVARCPPSEQVGPCEAPASIALSPSRPGGCTAGLGAPGATACDVTAALEGDFAAFEAAGDYTSKLLMVPKCRDTADAACLAREAEVGSRAGAGRALLVDKSATTAGDECNKVGVSYQAFNAQADPCWSPRGTCLANQLNDLYAADAAAVAAGRRPAFFVEAYKDTPTSGFTLTLGAGSSVAGGSVTMQFESRRYQKSLLSLTLPGSTSTGLVWRVLTSPATVSSPVVAPFEGASGSGVLSVVVTNTGAYKAAYTVSLACSTAVLPAPAQPLTLGAGNSAPLSFRLYAQALAAAEHECTVSVIDELQTVRASSRVAFNTSALEAGAGSQGGELASGAPVADAGSSDGGASDSCDTACSDSALDILCFVKHACGGKLAGLLGGALGVALGVGGAVWLAKRLLLGGGLASATGGAGLCSSVCRPACALCRGAVRGCLCPQQAVHTGGGAAGASAAAPAARRQQRQGLGSDAALRRTSSGAPQQAHVPHLSVNNPLILHRVVYVPVSMARGADAELGLQQAEALPAPPPTTLSAQAPLWLQPAAWPAPGIHGPRRVRHVATLVSPPHGQTS